MRELENEFYPNAKTIVHAVEDMLGLEAANLDGEDFSHERRFQERSRMSLMGPRASRPALREQASRGPMDLGLSGSSRW